MTGRWASLTLRGLGVIDEAEIELGPGLTVITGETGAGKTMVISGLGLLLGGRTDPAMVRHGYDAAVVEGRFHAAGAQVDEILIDTGGHRDEDDTVLVSRTISAEGRSRAHLAGRSVPAAALARIGELTVAVHGQDDQHRLRLPAQQRQALDRFAGPAIEDHHATYRAAFTEALDLAARLDEVVGHARERAREAEDLRELIALVQRVAPGEGEEAALRAESVRLSHSGDIAQAVHGAHEALEGGDAPGVRDLLATASAALGRAREHDPLLGELAERISRTQADVDDIALSLTGHLQVLDADPARVAYVEERRATLATLRRRLAHEGVDAVEDIATWAANAALRLEEISDDGSLVESLRAACNDARARAAAAAVHLSAARTVAAQALADAVTQELGALAMARARLVVQVRAKEGHGLLTLDVDGAPRAADRHGIDEVEFLLAARPDSPARPLAKAASGGERSRVMLALEVVFAGLDPVPTFVFDEVDAGVGGKAAVEVGHRLAILARSAQVIVVTHLAQVAAFADRHLVVRPGPVTSAGVLEVTGEDRLREIARMLAGLEDSPTAAAHAEELLTLAATRLSAGRSGRSSRRR